MSQTNGKQSRFHLAGSQEHYFGVRAGSGEVRPWLKSFPVCPALAQHQILHVGLARTAASLDFLPTDQNSTCFLACTGGKGRVRVDGRWYPCRAGTGCLLPSHKMDVFEDLGGRQWEFCWVCYAQPSKPRPGSTDSASVMAQCDPLPLRCAIEGLVSECSREAVPTVIRQWVDLIQSYVARFVDPGEHDERLAQLWERVSAQLNAAWDLARLAREAGYSYGHLRRLCHREFGRSPMHQVTYLRMHRAAELLETTNFKIEAVAEAVGYTNPFVFSNAFTKWIGWRPSEYRRKHNSKPAHTG
jgi:AraC-like DNA-binding protein